MQVDKNVLAGVFLSAVEATRVVMDIYNTDFDIVTKSDGTPITLADTSANETITKALRATGIGFISEETPVESFEIRKTYDYIWLVDPIDGTREFTHRNGEFTVNIALIYKGEPIFGIVTAPALGVAWMGLKGEGAWRADNLQAMYHLAPLTQWEEIMGYFKPMGVKDSFEKPVIAASRSHLTQNTLDMIKCIFGEKQNYTMLSKGSSIKFCMVAEGSANYYVRADAINEWDTAAGHAVLLAAGGTLLTWPELKVQLYNKEDLINDGFIACADVNSFRALLSKSSPEHGIGKD
jgi:3'(2'), 5'-bisphosphate nucleotidase